MEKDRIVLNNGTEILNGYAIIQSGTNYLHCIIPNKGVAKLFELFSNENNTLKIICYDSPYKHTYYGYNTIQEISNRYGEPVVDVYLSGENTREERKTIVPEEYLPEGMR